MKRDVTLSITGNHTIGDMESDNVATVAQGQYFKRNKSHYVLYEEAIEGYEEPCKNRIKFTENTVEMMKKGIVDTIMLFEENQTHLMQYQTPFGNLLFGVNTGKISVEEQEDHIVIYIDYVLELDEKPMSECNVKIEIRERA